MTTDTITFESEALDDIETLLQHHIDRGPPPEIGVGLSDADRYLRQIRNQRSNGTAIGLCGLPAAGKSHVAELMEGYADAKAISMGDAIRGKYAARHDNNEYSSEALADFAAEARSEDAAQIPGWVTDIADYGDADLYVIDGVRSVTDFKVLRDYFDEFTLVKVVAPFEERLQRIQERGREGEESFTRQDLLDRDLHELSELGYYELMNYDEARFYDQYLPSGSMEYDTTPIDYVVETDSDHLEDGIELLLDQILKT